MTAATRPEKAELVRTLGADLIVDYTRDDLTADGGRYDLIVENGGRLAFRSCWRALQPHGKLVFVGAGTGVGGPIGRYLGAPLRSRFLRQPVVRFISWESVDDLRALKEMIGAEASRP